MQVGRRSTSGISRASGENGTKVPRVAKGRAAFHIEDETAGLYQRSGPPDASARAPVVEERRPAEVAADATSADGIGWISLYRYFSGRSWKNVGANSLRRQ